MWNFDKCRLRRACAASTQNEVRSVAIIQETSRSEALLVAHATFLEISCRGSFFFLDVQLLHVYMNEQEHMTVLYVFCTVISIEYVGLFYALMWYGLLLRCWDSFIVAFE